MHTAPDWIGILMDGEFREYRCARFGDTLQLADALGRLVASGIKTATCSALWEYEAENEPLPTPGCRSIVLDGRQAPLCVIETTDVEIRRFCDVDAQFAYDEGEGDRSLDSWRREHWQFFTRSLTRIDRQPSDEMPLVCERFRLVPTGDQTARLCRKPAGDD